MIHAAARLAPGVERVEAVLLFDVLRFQPGAALVIRNVVVR